MITWRTRALEALRALAATGEPFTADDLADRVGYPDDDHGANGRNSGIGSVFTQAAAEGWIESDGRLVRSRQPRRKGGAIRVWRGVTASARGR